MLETKYLLTFSSVNEHHQQIKYSFNHKVTKCFLTSAGEVVPGFVLLNVTFVPDCATTLPTHSWFLKIKQNPVGVKEDTHSWRRPASVGPCWRLLHLQTVWQWKQHLDVFMCLSWQQTCRRLSCRAQACRASWHRCDEHVKPCGAAGTRIYKSTCFRTLNTLLLSCSSFSSTSLIKRLRT